MKKILFVFTTFFISDVFSQYTIEETDFPLLGDALLYAVDSNYSDPINNLDLIGDSISWNFLDLVYGDEIPLSFEDRLNFIGGNLFSKAKYGYAEGDFNYFMATTINAAKVLGVSTKLSQFVDTNFFDSSLRENLPDDVVFKYDKGGLYYLDFPANMGDKSTGTSTGVFSFYFGDTLKFDTINVYVDSIRILENVDYNSKIDAFGTVIIPDGDYYAIRQNVTYKRNYTVEAGFQVPFIGFYWFDVPLPTEILINQQVYRWFGKHQKFPIIEVVSELSQNVMISRFQIKPSGSQVGVAEQIATPFSLHIVDGVMQITTNVTAKYILITNSLGQVVKYKKPKSTTVNFNLIEKGVFYVSVFNADGSVSSKKVSFW